jgi:hypothetical protein
MHHHETSDHGTSDHETSDHEPRRNGARRLRTGLVALAVAGAAGLGLAGTAHAAPVSTATVDPVSPPALHPDPWDGCYVAFDEEVTPDDDCPPDVGGVVVDCDGRVCVVWPSGGVPGGVPDPDDPEEILCPPGLPASDPVADDQPCGGGLPPFDEPEGPFPG